MSGRHLLPFSNLVCDHSKCSYFAIVKLMKMPFFVSQQDPMIDTPYILATVGVFLPLFYGIVGVVFAAVREHMA